MKYGWNELSHLVQTEGRVHVDPHDNCMYFDWTCTGFRCTFVGTMLSAKIRGIENNFMGQIEWPVIGILNEKGEMKRITVQNGDFNYTLAEFDENTAHTVDVVKLSEGMRGQCGLLSLETDGEIVPAKEERASLHIELVGDSITCGYGNEEKDPAKHFDPKTENGYISYGALAARELGAKARWISVSGISTAVDHSRPMPFEMQGMEELYPYVDLPLEKKLGKTEFTLYDFKKDPVDAVVLNLGTNDVNMVKMAKPEKKEEALVFFRTHYRGMIEMIRKYNPEAMIFCCLGPLDYFLYDEIRDIVDEYKAKSGDDHIVRFKFGPVLQWSEGYGADMHPSAATHERMGHELAAMIRRYVCKEDGGVK